MAQLCTDSHPDAAAASRVRAGSRQSSRLSALPAGTAGVLNFPSPRTITSWRLVPAASITV